MLVPPFLWRGFFFGPFSTTAKPIPAPRAFLLGAGPLAHLHGRPTEHRAAGKRCGSGHLGGRPVQQKLYWLDYDPVALAVLVIGMGMIGLLALSI
jgi:hypothetical protein